MAAMWMVARMIAVAFATALVLAARARAAPAEKAVDRSELVGCAGGEELRTRGIHMVQEEPFRRESALLSVRVFGSVVSSRGPDRVWRERAICPGSTLASGDRLRISVWVGRPLYVYVVSTRHDGSAELLYPPEGRSAFVEVDKEVRLPRLSEAFELDDATGRESFWIVGSTSRLATEGASLRELLGALGPAPDARVAGEASTVSAAPSKRKSPKRPGVVMAASEKRQTKGGPDVAGLTTRGIIVRKDETTLEAWSPDKAGVVIAPFWLEHTARP